MIIHNFFDKSFLSPGLNKIPYLPFFKISFGPVGQFDEITNFFKDIASSKTLGKPSYKEDKIKDLIFECIYMGCFEI